MRKVLRNQGFWHLSFKKIICKGDKEYEIYINTSVEAEENTVYLDEIKIQVAEEFGDKIPEIKKAVAEEYKTVLVVEKMV